MSSIANESRSAIVSVRVYDGNDFKPDVLIGDSVAKLSKRGFQVNAVFNIDTKYGLDNIRAYDPEDEDSSPGEGGAYGIEVGHRGLQAVVYIDD